MFIASTNGRVQTYTSKNNAERALSHYLVKVCVPHVSDFNKIPLMECHQREDYAGAIQLWNNYIETNRRNDWYYKISISEYQPDQTFI